MMVHNISKQEDNNLRISAIKGDLGVKHGEIKGGSSGGDSISRVAAVLLVVLLIVVAIGVYLNYYYMPSGDEEMSMVIDGLTRTFIVHTPPVLSKDPALIIALHGGGGSGRNMEKLTLWKFDELSDKYGFVVMYPDGVDHHWNDGRNLSFYTCQRDNVDDVKFISHLIDFGISRYGVNPDRVFITGMSNGALMTFRLACEIPDKISAIATVGGLLLTNLSSCTPRPMNVLLILGTDDPIVPWDGGTLKFRSKELGEVESFNYTVNFWVNADNATVVKNKTYLPDADPNDGTRVWVEEFRGNGTVVAYGIDGGGHTWPSGYHYLPESLIGKTSNDINACEVIWDFFEGIHG